MGLYLGGLIIGRILASEIWGAYFREGLFLVGLLSEFYGIFQHSSFDMLNKQDGLKAINHSSLA